MAAFVILEDGRCLYRATVVIEGLLWRIAERVDADHPKLKTWLEDKSKRPAPFIDLWVGGFSESDREQFYAAARRAMTDEHAPNDGGSTEALDMLLKMKGSMDRGEPPSALSDCDSVKIFSGEPNDLDEIWGL